MTIKIKANKSLKKAVESACMQIEESNEAKYSIIPKSYPVVLFYNKRIRICNYLKMLISKNEVWVVGDIKFKEANDKIQKVRDCELREPIVVEIYKEY